MRNAIHINLNEAGFKLPSINPLSSLMPNSLFDKERDSRHPLGIYNISIARICGKVEKCSEKLEFYWKINIAQMKNEIISEILEEIISYIELSIYASAEHVDDIEEIVKTFFINNRLYSSNKNVKVLKEKIKPIRSEISKIANFIKHNHGRIRIFEMTGNHGGKVQNFLGFFVEGWKDGKVCPAPIIHQGKKIISITSLLWEILTYIFEISICLEDFLKSINAYKAGTEKEKSVNFQNAATKLARLPIYSFDDRHPFSRIPWIFIDNLLTPDRLDSKIYGSIKSRWSTSSDMQFSNLRTRYSADGTTKSFEIVAPGKLSLQHWR